MAVDSAIDSDAFLRPLLVDIDKLPVLATEFSKIYTHLAKHSTDQFLATPISVLPSGHETGKFLAIDLGGTNLRVAIIELLGPSNGAGPDEVDSIRLYNERLWPIGEHLKMDNAEDLFSWIGDCIAEVVEDCVNDPREDHHLAPQGKSIPLGITFSFPMIQSSISEATLMPMGKGFAITSNLDLAKLLLAGYARHTSDYNPVNGVATNPIGRGISRRKSRIKGLPPIEIAAITNDTVATLASLSYSANSQPPDRVAMGLIVGTGTNATIPMKLKDLHESKSRSVVLLKETDIDEPSVVVNTEWTIKGSAPPLRELGYITTWDMELDRNCEAPGFQPFEYMTGGRYLGELVRLIICDFLIRVSGVNAEHLPIGLRTRNLITTPFLGNVVATAPSSDKLYRELERQFPAPGPHWQWTPAIAALFIRVASLVKTRSAALTAAASVGLLICTGELSSRTNGVELAGSQRINGEYEKLLVAYTGGTIVYYPGFLEECQSYIDSIVQAATNRHKDVILRETKNGGIIGAAVLAGTVWHLSS